MTEHQFETRISGEGMNYSKCAFCGESTNDYAHGDFAAQADMENDLGGCTGEEQAPEAQETETTQRDMVMHGHVSGMDEHTSHEYEGYELTEMGVKEVTILLYGYSDQEAEEYLNEAKKNWFMFEI